ncbi:hypothetical protein FA10DRAFT_265754 [Acaromyces ingoldii]|uniref:Uncharacterized protein n=1 Tax=Acaromyces ingoldii TaxID=215250 RepID=A0A316YSD5_9BASI|nr:hypothetical protein FA10DRAFT_265754 [Acaromyces ingoldii]PWN91936.1 hypothetical protein FA10DRAFT_265754 [Acaromyces ingoldii]
MLSLSTHAHRQLVLVVLLLLSSTLCSLHAISAMPMPPGPQSNGNTEARSQERALLHRGHENGSPGLLSDLAASGVDWKPSGYLKMRKSNDESDHPVQDHLKPLGGTKAGLNVDPASSSKKWWNKWRNAVKSKLKSKSDNIRIEHSNRPGQHGAAPLLHNWDQQQHLKPELKPEPEPEPEPESKPHSPQHQRTSLSDLLEAEKVFDTIDEESLNFVGQHTPHNSPEPEYTISHGSHSSHSSPKLRFTSRHSSSKHRGVNWGEEHPLLAGTLRSHFPLATY